MKKRIIPAMSVVLGLLMSGCVVRSIYPWLPADTKVKDISLAGTWHDEKEGVTAFFASGSETNYSVLFLANKEDQSRFTVSLHRADKTLFLVVGPEDRNDTGAIVTLPAYLLFRVELGDNSMRLFDLDLDTFGERVKKANIKRLEEGDKDKGYILLSPTEELSLFIRSQLKDRSLFDEKPMYTFRKLSGK
jgi:hypothetical protein